VVGAEQLGLGAVGWVCCVDQHAGAGAGGAVGVGVEEQRAGADRPVEVGPAGGVGGRIGLVGRGAVGGRSGQADQVREPWQREADLIRVSSARRELDRDQQAVAGGERGPEDGRVLGARRAGWR
jgi:hypothetical protein